MYFQTISTTLDRDQHGLGFSIAGGRGSVPYKGNDNVSIRVCSLSGSLLASLVSNVCNCFVVGQTWPAEQLCKRWCFPFYCCYFFPVKSSFLSYLCSWSVIHYIYSFLVKFLYYFWLFMRIILFYLAVSVNSESFFFLVLIITVLCCEKMTQIWSTEQF